MTYIILFIVATILLLVFRKLNSIVAFAGITVPIIMYLLFTVDNFTYRLIITFVGTIFILTSMNLIRGRNK